MNAGLLALVLVVSQPPPVPDDGPPPVPQLNTVTAVAMPKTPRMIYNEARASAKAEGKPLVLFVGTPPRPVAGAMTVCLDEMPDGTDLAVVVTRDGDYGHWLSPNATDGEIQSKLALLGPEVSLRAEPFRPFFASQPATVHCSSRG